jgi:hypothetical protein
MPIRKLITLVSAWKGVDPPKFQFNSLYQMTETEKAEYDKIMAETEKIKADTEAAYVNMAARDSSEIRKEKGWAAEDVETEEADE